MNKQLKEALKQIPYYRAIPRKYRFTNQVKDKAWAILSDYVRCRDFLIYGTCIATDVRIQHWRECDAGHYESMGGHGAALGFSELNVHAQSKISNKLSPPADGARFKENLIKRYGKKILKEIESLKPLIKADDWYFLERIQYIYNKFLELKKKFPDFYEFPDYIK